MTCATHWAGGGRDRAVHGRATGPRRAREGGTLMKPKLVAFVTIVMLAGLLGGCTAAHNGLGTHDSACFRVYPEARAAVHGHGRFAGERYLPPRALIIELHDVVVPIALKDRVPGRHLPRRLHGPFHDLECRKGLGTERDQRAGSPSSSSVSTTSSCWPRWSSVGSRPGWSLPACFPGCDKWLFSMNWGA